ncbi:hypothetical protein QUI_2685 [Clostridioides difficile P59]|nr:hypothetical protein QUI_2685 [Clostridioides difficile P59]
MEMLSLFWGFISTMWYVKVASPVCSNIFPVVLYQLCGM